MLKRVLQMFCGCLLAGTLSLVTFSATAEAGWGPCGYAGYAGYSYRGGHFTRAYPAYGYRSYYRGYSPYGYGGVAYPSYPLGGYGIGSAFSAGSALGF